MKSSTGGSCMCLDRSAPFGIMAARHLPKPEKYLSKLYKESLSSLIYDGFGTKFTMMILLKDNKS